MRTTVIVLAAVLLGGVVVVTQQQRAEEDRQEQRAASLRTLSRIQVAPSGSAPQAGISARAVVDIAPFPDRLAKRLHGDADFHRLSHRCGVCHQTPDPRLHDAAGWDSVVTRMSAHIRDAGLLPLGDADRAAVLRALKEHGGSD